MVAQMRAPGSGVSVGVGVVGVGVGDDATSLVMVQLKGPPVMAMATFWQALPSTEIAVLCLSRRYRHIRAHLRAAVRLRHA